MTQKIQNNGGVDIVPYHEEIEVNKRKKPLTCSDEVCAYQFAENENIDFYLLGHVKKMALGYEIRIKLFSLKEKGAVAEWSTMTVKERIYFKESFDEFVSRIQPEIQTWIVKSPLMDLPIENADFDEGTSLLGEVLPDTLYAYKSPYRMNKSMAVPTGKTTVIEPGVVVLVGDIGANIHVYGQIIALGTEKDHILFRSMKKFAQPGDWGRIIVNSTLPSAFRYVDLMHSAYGLQVVHSTVNISQSRFFRNKFVGIYALDAHLNIDTVRLIQGHSIGLQADIESKILARDLVLKNNNIGLHLADYSRFDGQNIKVLDNHVGLALDDTIRFVSQHFKIDNNEIAIQSSQNIFDSLMNMKRNNNELDDEMTLGRVILNQNRASFKKNTSQEKPIFMTGVSTSDRQLFKVKSNSIKPIIDISISENEDDKELWSTSGRMNWTTGYIDVKTPRWTGVRPFFDGADTILKGQNFRNDFLQDGQFQNAQSALSFEKGDQSLDITVDVVHDAWTDWYFYPATLKYTNSRHELTLGDFTVSSEPWMLSARTLIGAQYRLNEDSENRFPYWTFHTFYGENQRPIYPNLKNRDNFGEIVINGNAIPQRMMQYYNLSFFMSDIYAISMGGVILDDQRKKLIGARDDFKSGIFFREPIQDGRTFSVYNHFKSFTGDSKLKVFFLYGEGDTLNILQKKAVDQWMSDNNMFDSLSLELSNFLIQNPYTGPSQIVNLVSENLSKTPQEILSEIDSIRQILEDSSSARKFLGFHNSFANMAAGFEAEFKWANQNLNLNAGFLGNRFFSVGAPGLIGNSRVYGARYQSSFWDWWSNTLEYNLRVEQASGDIDSPNLFGFGEGSFWGLEMDKKALNNMNANRERPIYFQDWTAQEIFKPLVNFELRLDYFGRYTMQFQNKSLNYDTNKTYLAVFADPYFSDVNSMLKMTTSFGDTFGVDVDKWTRLNSKEEWASEFEERRLFQQFGLGLKYTFKPKNFIQFNPNVQFFNDLSVFHVDSGYKQFKLEDSTFAKLGYFFNRINTFTYEYPVAMSLNWKNLLQSTTRLKMRFKSFEFDSEETQEYSLAEKLNVVLIENKLNWSVSASMRKRNGERFGKRYFLTDSLGARYNYIESETPSQQETFLSEDINSSTYVENFDLNVEQAIIKREEFDWSVGSNLNWNLTTRWNSNCSASYDHFGRFFDLAEEYSTWRVAAGLGYEF